MGKWDSSDDDEETIKKEEPLKKQKIQKDVSIKAIKAITPLIEATVDDEYNPSLLGCRSVECYEPLGFIDEGSYGMVFRAKDTKTGIVYALKRVKLESELTSKVGFPITALREINILMALRHPNIIKVKEMVVGSDLNKQVFMVMEYCENDLKKCMESRHLFSIGVIKRLMLQLLSAIDHMHSHWYIHRDLKTSNLLYSNKGVLCVCDFGLARKYGDPVEPYTFEVVTLWYRAPELLLGSRVYSTPIDMWSVGCIFAEMFLGHPIFPGEGEVDQISKIFTALGLPNEDTWPGVTSLANWSSVPSQLPPGNKIEDKFPTKAIFSGGILLSSTGKDLLLKLLKLDPSKRLTAEAALTHPWFAELPTPAERMPSFEVPEGKLPSAAVPSGCEN